MLSPVPALTNYVTLRPKASNLFQLLDAYFLTCGFQILFLSQYPDARIGVRRRRFISHSGWRALGL